MTLDPRFDTALLLTCRACGHVDRYLVPEGDAVAVEAAYADNDPVLSFQCADVEGQLRTTNVTSADFRRVQRAPLTPQEIAELRRKKPAPAVPLTKLLSGASDKLTGGRS